jgi:serine/threonine-protein kinase
MHAGQTVGGRYQVLRPLSSGARSQVWLARDLRLERRVAIKLLDPAADQRRAAREAQVLASLSHPNIAQVYDSESDEGGTYLVVEFVEGRTLRDELAARGKLDPDHALGIASELAAALAHAHRRGVVHRDIKPENVVLDQDGRARLIDFGVARRELAHLDTLDATTTGTLAYMAPEVLAGEPGDARSDIYSLAVVTCEMLTGSPRRAREPLPPSSIRPEVAAVIAAALSERPASRPKSAGEFGAALIAAQTGRRTANRMGTQEFVPPGGRPLVATAHGRGQFAAVAVLAGAILGAGALVAVAAFDWGRESTVAVTNTPTATATRTPSPTRTPAPTATPTPRPTRTPEPTIAPQPNDGFFDSWDNDVNGFFDAIEDWFESLP